MPTIRYDPIQWTIVQDNVWDKWGKATGYNWTTTANASYTITQSTTASTWANEWQPRVWKQWTTNRYTINVNANTITLPPEAQLTYNGELDNPIQRHVWGRWNRFEVRERETREQEQARLDREQAAREERNRQWLAEQARAEGARERAKELLEMMLTTEEKLMREQTGKVTVRGSEGGLYELDLSYHGVHGNIVQVDEHGCRLARLCVQPNMYDREARVALPLEDGFVGQLLGLKFNEAEFVAKANRSQVAACRQPNVPILGAAA